MFRRTYHIDNIEGRLSFKNKAVDFERNISFTRVGYKSYFRGEGNAIFALKYDGKVYLFLESYCSKSNLSYKYVRAYDLILGTQPKSYYFEGQVSIDIDLQKDNIVFDGYSSEEYQKVISLVGEAINAISCNSLSSVGINYLPKFVYKVNDYIFGLNSDHIDTEASNKMKNTDWKDDSLEGSERQSKAVNKVLRAYVDNNMKAVNSEQVKDYFSGVIDNNEEITMERAIVELLSLVHYQWERPTCLYPTMSGQEIMRSCILSAPVLNVLKHCYNREMGKEKGLFENFITRLTLRLDEEMTLSNYYKIIKDGEGDFKSHGFKAIFEILG